MYLIEPLYRVYMLSGLTVLFGHIMDINISTSSIEYYCSDEKRLRLYIEGQKKLQFNLLLVSPFNYLIAYNYLLDTNVEKIQIFNLCRLLILHNFLYFVLHYSVHKIKSIRFIHHFHHLFKVNTPSIGNSVSYLEFQILYVTPFLIGMYLFNPNPITLDFSIGIISFLNTLIHCDEFKGLYWIPFLVSSKQHCEHHDNYSSTYSAPLINFDLIFKNDNKKIINK